jgi:hypothetical protein
MVRNYMPIISQLSLDWRANGRGSLLEYGRSQFEASTNKASVGPLAQGSILPIERGYNIGVTVTLVQLSQFTG